MPGIGSRCGLGGRRRLHPDAARHRV